MHVAALHRHPVKRLGRKRSAGSVGAKHTAAMFVALLSSSCAAPPAGISDPSLRALHGVNIYAAPEAAVMLTRRGFTTAFDIASATTRWPCASASNAAS
jgi:hypothetical protein